MRGEKALAERRIDIRFFVESFGKGTFLKVLIKNILKSKISLIGIKHDIFEYT